MERELEKFEPKVAEALLEEVKSRLATVGIMLKASSVENFADESADGKSNVDWLRNFIIETDAPAFYLKIQSPEDIVEVNQELERHLSALQDKLKNFLQNNADLEDRLKSKINTFASSMLTQAKKIILQSKRL